MKIKKNIGNLDRAIRLIFGIVAFVLVFVIDDLLIQLAFFSLGVFSVYESLSSWCLFYMLIGKNTCPLE